MTNPLISLLKRLAAATVAPAWRRISAAGSAIVYAIFRDDTEASYESDGYAGEACPMCGGDGEILINQVHDQDRRKCPACDGKGLAS